MLFNVFYAAHQANLNIILISRTPDTSVKFSLKSDRVNLVAPASHIECLFYLPGDTVQTGTGKVDPTRKFKCTTTARGLICLETNKANEQNEITKKSEITKTTVSSEQMDRY